MSQPRGTWFKNIEYLTWDLEGYLRWKDRVIEHFDEAYARSERSTEYARELARRCAILDRDGVVPSALTVLCTWQEPSALLIHRTLPGNS